MTIQKLDVLSLYCLLLLIVGSVSCNSTPSDQDRRQRDEKTREEAAKATERIKPELRKQERS